MKLGPLDLPVSNAMQLLTLVALVAVIVYGLHLAPIPDKYKPQMVAP